MKNMLKAVICIIGIGISASGHSQTYQTSISPLTFQVSVVDQGGGGNPGIQLTIPGATLIDNITINSGAQTFEESGTLTLGSGSQTSTIEETRTLAAVFPNPPTIITGALTLTLSCAGGVVPFDTGPQHLSFVGGSIWSFNGTTTLGVPLNISYSLVTGGQTYSGSLSPILGLTFDNGSKVNVSNYPNSVSLIPDGSALLADEVNNNIANLTAGDGFNMELAAVPEPSTIALSAGGVVAFMLFRRKK